MQPTHKVKVLIDYDKVKLSIVILPINDPVIKERYLPDEIVERILSFKTVKDAAIELDKRFIEYQAADEIFRRQLALTPLADQCNRMMLTRTYRELSLAMRTRVYDTWQSTIKTTLDRTRERRYFIDRWIDAKVAYEAALLKVA